MYDKEIKILKIIKYLNKRDLTEISFPVYINEPLSFLQSICTWLEY